MKRKLAEESIACTKRALSAARAMDDGMTRMEVRRKFKTSRGSVGRARYVLSHGGEDLVEALESGELALTTAKNMAAKRRRKALNQRSQDTEAIKDRRSKAYERLGRQALGALTRGYEGGNPWAVTTVNSLGGINLIRRAAGL
tara:strand:- start:44 stop:472 length:429 start_codon:yes stop_codon:yes gene_type:complete